MDRGKEISRRMRRRLRRRMVSGYEGWRAMVRKQSSPIESIAG
jgi:hypothetical protein